MECVELPTDGPDEELPRQLTFRVLNQSAPRDGSIRKVDGRSVRPHLDLNPRRRIVLIDHLGAFELRKERRSTSAHPRE
jgi:hypothetical protein